MYVVDWQHWYLLTRLHRFMASSVSTQAPPLVSDSRRRRESVTLLPCSIAFLLQSLLSHPNSSTQAFPTFFAQLPTGIQRLPRMGGWEEEPPPANDPRLGDENLPKHFVPMQKPFEVVLTVQRNGEGTSSLTSSIGQRAASWLLVKAPLLSTRNDTNSFHVHSLSVHANQGEPQSSTQPRSEQSLVCHSDEALFSAEWSDFQATWLSSAIDSCSGDQAARERLSALPKANL